MSDLGNVTKVGYNLDSGTLLSYNSSTSKWVPLAPPVVNNSLFVYDTGTSGWSNTTFEIGSIGGVDLTVPPNLNETLTYNGTNWSAKDISATQGTGRGDAGNFTTEGDYGFVSNIYGGGNFTTGSDDGPAELSGSGSTSSTARWSAGGTRSTGGAGIPSSRATQERAQVLPAGRASAIDPPSRPRRRRAES